ncbi:MAG: IPT/TIG domain-containing protein [Phycisphaerales bacterium]|nr:MAG: IPT/TIG domain-containing protein [Phycisphaerales bacterium]
MCSSVSTQSRIVGSIWLTVPAAALSLLTLSGCPRASVQDIAGELFDRPQVELVSPTSGPATGGTKVTIRGRNFNPSAGVLFGDTSADSVSYMNRGLIEAVTPPQPPSMVDITVINAVGQKTVVENAFQYVEVEPPAPRPVTLGGIMPTQAPATAHTPITIFGANFSEGMVVMLGAFICDEVLLVNPHTLQAVAPPQGPGFVDLVVLGPDGETVTMADAFEYVPAVPDDLPGPPRLVSAVSTSNTTVRVTFSEPVEEGAEDPSNYSIVQTNVNPEAGVLHVVSATLEPGQTVVTLVTFSQNEVVYTLTVTNIKDLAGNEFATPGIMVNPTQTSFAGTPPVEDQADDTDGDGLPDHVEQRGWTVHVRLSNGSVEERGVTSDPTSPDTDQDGVGDQEEFRRGMDPRNPDTDADQVSDKDEVGTWFSDPTDQDTDQDGLADISDIYFKTSPILGDTDGDGFDDWHELFEMNRNPRLANLPQPELTVGDMRLQIDERYSYVDHEGKTVTHASSSNATLSQSQSMAFRQSDTTSNETSIEGGFSAELGYNSGPVAVFKPHLKAGGKWGSTSQVSQETATAAQQVYQHSLAKGRTYTTASTVTREVYGASIDTALTLGNASDIAFTLSNIEISVLQPGRLKTQFIPVATLLPSSELLTGEPAAFTLLPDEDRGPIIFSNREVFPNLVDKLLRSPLGLMFKVSYFDVTDEFGRNLAFTTQDVFERTATLTVDAGDGTFERHYVATSGGLDTNRYVGGGLVGGYDATGIAKGIPMDFVLQDILGLVKNPEEPNAIVAGANKSADTVAEADDVQAIPAGTTGLPDRAIVVLAGENGVLDTVPNNVNPDGDDEVGFTTGYQTSRTCNADTEARIVEPTFGGDGIASTVAVGDDVQEVPPRACIGGSKDGQSCTTDTECREAWCELMEVCIGGHNTGNPCTVNRECVPHCDGGSCVGGEAPGEGCSEDTDCAEVSCDTVTLCVGGEKEGESCTEDAQCLPYCENNLCVGGERDGQSCDTDRECNPTCDNEECVGGDRDGETCSLDSDCITTTCAPVSICVGGDKEGQLCSEYADCFVSECVPVRICTGGDQAGFECSEDRDCVPHCDNDICVGGDNVGNDCSEDRDCVPHCEEDLCIGGDNEGAACSEDRECAAHCPQFVCFGGEYHGNPCSNHMDCAAYCESESNSCVGGDNEGAACSEDRECRPYCETDVCVGGPRNNQSCVEDADCIEGTCTSDVILPGRVIVSAGADGLLETVPSGDEVYMGPGEPCADNEDCPGGACNGREILVRYGNSVTGDPKRYWVVISSEEMPIGGDFADYLFTPNEAVTLAFGQDIDRDGLFAREEYIHGSSDLDKDTDSDELGDFAEIREGWTITVYKPRTAPAYRDVFSDPTLADSDFDGVPDKTELQCRTDPRARDTDDDGLSDATELGVCTANGDLASRLDREVGVEPCAGNDAIGDVDRDGLQTPLLKDDVEVTIQIGEESFVMILAGENGILDSKPFDGDDYVSTVCRPVDRWICASTTEEVCPPKGISYQPEYLDPRNADTDGDSLSDGFELAIPAEDGGPANPLDPGDADEFRDTDQDGLTDQQEKDGWDVVVELCEGVGCVATLDAYQNEILECKGGFRNGEVCTCPPGDLGSGTCAPADTPKCHGPDDTYPDPVACNEEGACGGLGACVQDAYCAGGPDSGRTCDPGGEDVCSAYCDGDQCVGGPYAGDDCQEDTDCLEALCVKRCQGGGNDGNACESERECGPHCAEGECVGGNDGATCEDDLICYPHCDLDVQECVGGNDGATCDDDQDCYPTCVTKQCHFGDNAGATCDDDRQCNPYCELSGDPPAGVCVGGDNHGATCQEDRECNPYCQLSGDPPTGVCVGGDNDGATCDEDRKCNPHCDLDAAEPTCVGGEIAGAPCVEDRQCKPHCCEVKAPFCDSGLLEGESCGIDEDCFPEFPCESICISGDFAGESCDSNRDCHPYCDTDAAEPKCVGGIRESEDCDRDSDCSRGNCSANPLGPICRGGREDGKRPCDCPGGYCDFNPSVCEGGDRDGQFCDCPGGICAVVETRYVAPLPTEGDSDFDGLPDLLEYLGADGLPPDDPNDSGDATDPTAVDSDDDGISDYDEFAEFALFMPLSDVHPGFYLSGADSQCLGTNPTSQDTDHDRLPDFFEKYGGWRVFAAGDEAPRMVFADPLYADTDLDGLQDLDEYLGVNGLPPSADQGTPDATDPTDPDTDNDGRLDGPEVLNATNPLMQDLHVTVTYSTLILEGASSTTDPCDGADGLCTQIVTGHSWYSWFLWWHVHYEYRCVGGLYSGSKCRRGVHADCSFGGTVMPERPGWWWTLWVRKDSGSGRNRLTGPPANDRCTQPSCWYDSSSRRHCTTTRVQWPWYVDGFSGYPVAHQCQWLRETLERMEHHTGLCHTVTLWDNELVPIDRSVDFQMLPGESFQLFVEVAEIDKCGDCDKFEQTCLNCATPEWVEKACAMRGQQTYAFEDLMDAQGSTRFYEFRLGARDPDAEPEDPATDGGCGGIIYAEIRID